MSEPRESNQGTPGLLTRLLLRLKELLRRLLRRGSPATEVVAEKKLQPDAERLAPYVAERDALLQTTKIAAIALGVLFVLNIEYTPMVIADEQLESQYSGQVRSLILVEGYVGQLDQSITNGLDAWKQRVVEQVERALGQVIALDDYDQALSTWERAQGPANQGAKPPVPQFLKDCATFDPEIAPWIMDPPQVHDHWRDLVARCIIEPMGADFTAEERERIMPRLDDAQAAVVGAIADARIEFPLPEEIATAPPLAPSATPTPVPTELAVRTALDQIEIEVSRVVRIVERAANAAVLPSPRNWLTQFTGEDGSLRSFRDNLLLAYTSPFGTKLVATNRSPSAPIRVPESATGTGSMTINRTSRILVPRPVSATLDPLVTSTLSFTVALNAGAERLEVPLSEVIDKQEALQDLQTERADEIQAAVPGVLQPILAVARPKYLVLLYPLAVALIGAYLLSRYTRLQWKAAPNGTGDAPMLTVLVFLGLACTPIGILLSLFRPYDWPQYTDSWWFWTHRGSLLVVLAVTLACMVALLRSRLIASSSGSRALAKAPVSSPAETLGGHDQT